jgi:hypothetical protein
MPLGDLVGSKLMLRFGKPSKNHTREMLERGIMLEEMPFPCILNRPRKFLHIFAAEECRLDAFHVICRRNGRFIRVLMRKRDADCISRISLLLLLKDEFQIRLQLLTPIGRDHNVRSLRRCRRCWRRILMLDFLGFRFGTVLFLLWHVLLFLLWRC